MRRVKVYYNLHRKCLSVQHKGLVVAHAHSITLANVQFKVSEAGRQRVLEQKRKNVHAFIVGDEIEASLIANTVPVTYNPYKFTSFVNAETLEPINHASFVSIEGRKVRAC